MRAIAVFLATFLSISVGSAASVAQTDQLRQAMQLYDSGNYAEALALYKKMLEVDPKNSTLLYEAGLTAQALGDLKACIAYATDSFAANPRHALALGLLGTCQDDSGDAKAALESFERGLAISPADAQINFNYALTLARLNRAADSRKHVEIAIVADPTRPSAYLLYAGILDALQFDGAAALIRLRFMTFESETPRAADAASAIVKRAEVYRKQGNEKNLVVNGLEGATGPDKDIAMLNLAFGLGVAAEDKYVPADATDAARFVNAMQSLSTVTSEVHDKSPGVSLVWKHAGAPLQELSQRGLLQAFLYQAAAMAKLGGGEEWLKDHAEEQARLQSTLHAMRANRGTIPPP